MQKVVVVERKQTNARSESHSGGVRGINLALAWCAALTTGCPTPQLPPGEADRRALTAQLTNGVMVPAITDVVEAARALGAAANAHAATDGAADEERAVVQQAWRDTMAAWQVLEVLHFGPAGSPASFVGGLGLRERVYAWPQVNLCAVDTQIVANTFEEEGWAVQRLPNVIGLGPLEYVLFFDGAGNACPADAALNAAGTWAALGDAEVRARRARYARVLADDLEAQVLALDDAWRSGGFAASLRAAGEKGSSFGSAQEALDNVFAALFALELVTKDKRLGVPAGLHADCAEATCPDALESRFSRTSRENVVINIETARRVFLGVGADGTDGFGFDDLLRAREAADVADAMTASVTDALTAAQEHEGAFEDALLAEPASVQLVHATLKVFTDDLKSVFPSTLGLRVPDEGAGDND